MGVYGPAVISDLRSPFYRAGPGRSRALHGPGTHKPLMRRVLLTLARPAAGAPGVTRPVPAGTVQCPMLVVVLAAVAGAALAAILFLTRQGRLTADAARLDAELAAARRALDDQRAALADAQTRLSDSFAALSRD